MSDDSIDWIARAGTRAKGKRPDFLGDPTSERMLSILLAVAGEVSVLKERLDTVERLLDAKGTISRADIEGYNPDRDAAYERAVMTKEYIARIMRGVQQEMEAMQVQERPVADISADLKDN
ncbi:MULTISPECIES: hypothetical protein [Sphingomonas]|uniref:Uncharacterized protein n=1 Tax=Edaphosphingomonas fennica TaxID=114404 RepID=A0A2T4I722_9SPHN|nr:MULTISPECIES: hypothetical protein [Sphingomonas]MDX3882933.1 hypothetical protein [Sphingomonas sp.]PTD26599.1 hypothetical protein CV103_02910 [Sphingomonas fennica]